jgi:hypothetical protein
VTVQSELEAAAEAISSEELRSVYLCLANEVVRRVSSGFSGSWNYQQLAKWAGRSLADPILQSAVQMLVVKRFPQILQMHFRLFLDDDDVGQEIDDNDVRQALRVGYLIDNEGNRVEDFGSRLTPYFVPLIRSEDDYA